MDTLENYRQIIQQLLTEYTKIPYAYGEIKTSLIVDRESDDYLLVNIGWHDERRVHGCLVHINITDGKIWIQRDGTEGGIANELVAAGIPKDRIILGFHPPEVRQYTGYAVT